MRRLFDPETDDDMAPRCPQESQPHPADATALDEQRRPRRRTARLSRVALCCGLALTLSAHDWYTGKTTQGGGSCCNGEDCKPVSAWQADDGHWQFRYTDGKTYDVPEEAVHPDHENPEPFQASGCVWNGKVLCFWRKRAGG